MTLYLKYRPQTLEELDPENVRESLKKIVASGKIPHAFLFSGPKGTGKTSAARIIAKIVNCEKLASPNTKHRTRNTKFEPCNKCYQCTSITNGENLDVVELDAASHRGIDDVRLLKDAVKLAPAEAKMKVYIIDEAHMLTTEASNALLKTLEEPPSHVMFILATTNPEKLVETIRSRTTTIVFKKATLPELVRSLSKIVKGEKVKIEGESLEAIAKASGGSFRDAAKILEQLISEDKKLDKDSVEEFLFQKRTFSVDKFLTILAKRDVRGALAEIENASSSGVQMKVVAEAVIERLRSILLAKVGVGKEDSKEFNKEEVVLLIKLFSEAVREMPDAVLEQIPLEITVIEWCQDKVPAKGQSSSGRKSEEPEAKIKNGGKSVTPVVGETRQRETVQVREGNGVSEEVWGKILGSIRPKNTSTEALLRAAMPMGFDGKTLTLGVYYRFHKERLEEHPHRMLLEDAVSLIFGSPVRVVCTLTMPPAKLKPSEDGKVSADSQEVSDGEPEKTLTKPESVLTEADDEDIIKVAKEIFGS